ncbi:class I SAM-dependent methyltransferase [Duganella violaceipulchra]|uniref:Class I SAM-dependent methyltransferase n=1 Tax=Duganella violaceipulchra TaxID=2849652 RepID=A0AA41H974_9BURK|nr:class I SAM-dependent methyltransferase [Duganella violaceicalia]MBV6321860.1 class I SAM-dependent methyltransferase [Duganella violaceicalia]MCP2007146.1 putative O-methyltransferase YrrM [Duganella violaceicalia]
MSLLAFPALALLLAVSLYALHKLRHVHVLLYDVRDQHRNDQAGLFRQLEALQGLYVELDLKHSLPPTRGWAASPDFLLEVARHARSLQQATVVECSSGISTLVLARCMQLNGGGKVYSLEHDRHFAAQTRAQLRRHGLQDWATVIDAPLTPHDIDGQAWPWYDLARLPEPLAVDLLVIDGPPQATRPLARFPAGPLLFPRLRAGAAVFLDDAARPDEQEILQRWRQAFPELAYTQQTCEKGCAVLRKG